MGSDNSGLLLREFDKNYHRRNLERMLRDLNDYNADEYARELLRLVCVADHSVMCEEEFMTVRMEEVFRQMITAQ